MDRSSKRLMFPLLLALHLCVQILPTIFPLSRRLFGASIPQPSCTASGRCSLYHRPRVRVQSLDFSTTRSSILRLCCIQSPTLLAVVLDTLGLEILPILFLSSIR